MARFMGASLGNYAMASRVSPRKKARRTFTMRYHRGPLRNISLIRQAHQSLQFAPALSRNLTLGKNRQAARCPIRAAQRQKGRPKPPLIRRDFSFSSQLKRCGSPIGMCGGDCWLIVHAQDLL